MAEIPTLNTARLILRGHAIDDLAASAALWADPTVTRHIGGRPFTREESWARLLRYIGHWDMLGYGFWAVIEKATGRFIGEAGLADFKRDIETPLNGYPEIGWALMPDYHGKGYATEAVQALVDWGDVRFQGGRTVCLINPDNQPSIRVAEKSGYCRAGIVEYKGNSILLFSREQMVAKAAASPVGRR